MMRYTNYIIGFVVALMLGACSDSSKPAQSGVPTVATLSHIVVLNSALTKSALGGSFDGAVVFAGAQNLAAINTGSASKVAASRVAVSAANALTPGLLTSRDLAGFVAEVSAPFGDASASEVLTSLENIVRADGFSRSVSVTSRQEFINNNSANLAMEVMLFNAEQPTDLIVRTAKLIAVSTPGGAITSNLTPLVDEPFAESYTVNIGVSFFSVENVVVSLTVVPSDRASSYAHLSDDVTSPSNVVSKGVAPQVGGDTFVAEAGGGLADFLFVIDNSGSMRDEQLAISEAADTFEAAILNSGLDFQMGIISTDSDTLRDGLFDGAFTSDFAEFKNDIVLGTGGSSIETGIFFAESSLLSISQGDITDGSVTLAGYPRAGAKLSVIIMSDEISQYASRSGFMFDPLNNLFVSRDISVFAIVEPSDEARSQYDDLANATGGSVADIDELSVFDVIMKNIAVSAGAAASAFALSEMPVSATIKVTVNGLLLTGSEVDGWTYDFASNRIALHGDAIPVGGEVIAVTYSYIGQ